MTDSGTRFRRLVVIMLFLPILMSVPAARAWDADFSIGAGVTYSDNINRAPRGEEESELVFQLVPTVSASRQGGRGRAELRYSAQGLAYAEDSDRNTVFHQFRLQTMTELVKEFLTLDAGADYSQRLIDPQSDLGSDLITREEDFSDVLTYWIGPRIRQRLGAHATADLSLQHRAIKYRDASDLDSTSNGVDLQINSGAQFQRLEWQLRYSRDRTDYDDDASAEFERYSGLLRFNLTDQFSVFAEAGREGDDFDQAGERSRPSGDIWRGGATWTPTTRTQLEGFYANRYFGSFVGGSLRHRFRHSTWTFDYDEEPSTSALIAPEFPGIPVPGGTDQPILDEDGNPVVTDDDFFTPTTESFIRRRANLAVQGQRSRIGWRLRAFREEREFEFSDRDEAALGAGFGLSYRVASRTRLTFDYDWLRTERDTEDETSRTVRSHRARLGLQYDIGRRTALSANYQFVDSDSSGEEQDAYQENRVTLFLNTRF